MSISCERPSRNLIKNSVYSLIYRADSTVESSIVTLLPKLPTYEDDQRIKTMSIGLGNMCSVPQSTKRQDDCRGVSRGTHSRVAERTRLFPVREYSGKY